MVSGQPRLQAGWECRQVSQSDINFIEVSSWSGTVTATIVWRRKKLNNETKFCKWWKTLVHSTNQWDQVYFISIIFCLLKIICKIIFWSETSFVIARGRPPHFTTTGSSHSQISPSCQGRSTLSELLQDQFLIFYQLPCHCYHRLPAGGICRNLIYADVSVAGWLAGYTLQDQSEDNHLDRIVLVTPPLQSRQQSLDPSWTMFKAQRSKCQAAFFKNWVNLVIKLWRVGCVCLYLRLWPGSRPGAGRDEETDPLPQLRVKETAVRWS